MLVGGPELHALPCFFLLSHVWFWGSICTLVCTLQKLNTLRSEGYGVRHPQAHEESSNVKSFFGNLKQMSKLEFGDVYALGPFTKQALWDSYSVFTRQIKQTGGARAYSLFRAMVKAVIWSTPEKLNKAQRSQSKISQLHYSVKCINAISYLPT